MITEGRGELPPPFQWRREFAGGVILGQLYAIAEGRLETQIAAISPFAARKLGELFQRAAGQAERLAVGRAFRRLLRRQRQVLDRALHVAAAAVMMRELGHVIVEMVVPQRIDRGRDALVQYLAPLSEYRVVGNIVRQCVLEGVLEVAAAKLFENKFALLQAR